MRKNCSGIVVERLYEPCILYVLMRGDNYGYAIQKYVAEDIGCSITLSNMYRTLKRLQDAGHVVRTQTKSGIGPDKSVYRITESGIALLRSWKADLVQKHHMIGAIINHCSLI